MSGTSLDGIDLGPTDPIASRGGAHNLQMMAHHAGFLPGGGYLKLWGSRRSRRRRKASRSPSWRT
jgi:hypothetical protein